jgi:hypothetical protein
MQGDLADLAFEETVGIRSIRLIRVLYACLIYSIRAHFSNFKKLFIYSLKPCYHELHSTNGALG